MVFVRLYNGRGKKFSGVHQKKKKEIYEEEWC